MIMRNYLSFFFFMFLSVCISVKLNSQTLTFYSENNAVINSGDTITCTGTPQTSEISAYMKVKNISNSNVQVSCTKEYITIINGSSNTFCWANSCYPPATFTSNSIIINADSINNGFSADYFPNNNAGISVIKYVFGIYHGDSAWIFVKFNATGSGIGINNMTAKLFNPYPNPANSNVFIPVYLPSAKNGILEVYDICGKLKNKISVHPNTSFVNLPVNSYPEGLYFVQFKVNGMVVGTEKIMVKHF
jgi:hypothetical protein